MNPPRDQLCPSPSTLSAHEAADVRFRELILDAQGELLVAGGVASGTAGRSKAGSSISVSISWGSLTNAGSVSREDAC